MLSVVDHVWLIFNTSKSSRLISRPGKAGSYINSPFSRADRREKLTISWDNSILPSYCALKASKYVSVSLDLGLLVLFIFLIFSAFSHEKTGTRWSDASEKLEDLVDFPTTRPKLPWNCPGCEMPNYCVLKHIYLQFNSEFKPIQVK
jgi:hypothetical protein